MTPERWQTIARVFDAALMRPAAERAAWLAHICADDQKLLRDVEALLSAHDTAGDFLEAPLALDPADIAQALAPFAPGARVGAYRLVDELGRGGMGVVYLAEDERLGRRVALKSLPPLFVADPERRERLRREARAAATVVHPCVAVVYALEEFGDHLLLVTEHVNGRTLRAEMASGAMPAERVERLALDIARALCAAHEAGVIHRDLKPENVMITPDAGVKVVDFGIAAFEDGGPTRLTLAGAAVGTPAYMAPEQLMGKKADGRSDLYALGVLIVELATGAHPLADASAVQRVPERLRAIAQRLLQPEPAHRYPNARAVVNALERPVRTATGRWWWEFHLATTTLVYALMLLPAWEARRFVNGPAGRALFYATLAAVIVAGLLRLHLWFTSHYYPAELPWVRARARRPIRAADWALAAALLIGGLTTGDDRSPLAVLLVAVALGSVVAFLVIEPATERAAFPDRTS